MKKRIAIALLTCAALGTAIGARSAVLEESTLVLVKVLDRITTKEAKSGDIVLFHNDAEYTVDALPTILKDYQARGLTVVPVSEILLQGDTSIDIQGRMHPAKTKIPEV